jgi:hypothetical protein
LLGQLQNHLVEPLLGRLQLLLSLLLLLPQHQPSLLLTCVRVCPALPVVLHGHRVLLLLLLLLRPLQPCLLLLLLLQLRLLLLHLWLPHQLLQLPLLPLQLRPSKDCDEDFLAWQEEPPGPLKVFVLPQWLLQSLPHQEQKQSQLLSLSPLQHRWKLLLLPPPLLRLLQLPHPHLLHLPHPRFHSRTVLQHGRC